MIATKLLLHRRRMHMALRTAMPGQAHQVWYVSVVGILAESSIFYTICCIVTAVLTSPGYESEDLPVAQAILGITSTSVSG
jgi:hypothetical protein